ncbi:fibronectin type III domain-containing protein [Acidovorax sp. M2(2025)]|uniref:fibronectin type III domain-containing protein n=1 Tax=Acidovorax sp. M2(2025) TaxID=3411355 RepID=UPI003BF5C6E3
MLKRRLPALLIGPLLASGAWASPPTLLYDGNTDPVPQGWQQLQQSPHTETVGDGTNGVDAGTTRFTTANAGSTSGQNLYTHSVGTANFITSIRLKALSVNPHNTGDAGLMFSATDAFAPPFGSSANRSHMLYLDSATVGWGDDTGGTAPFNSLDGAFHEYALRYLNGQLSVYIDADYADIASGAATPLLSRSFVPSTTASAMVLFGDQSNDPNVNSDFVVDYVKFQNLDLPDPPASITATGSDGSVSVAFTPPAGTGSSAISSYSVTATGPGDVLAGSCTPTPALPASGQTASCVITGLTNGVTYTLSVSAVNASGAGPAATATAQPRLVPAAGPAAVPSLSPAGLASLAAMLAAVAAGQNLRRRRRETRSKERTQKF